MRLNIEMEGKEWKEILDSLHKVISGEEDIPRDLNIIAEPDDTVKIYVRNYYNLQVIHELKDTTDRNITVEDSSKFVFNSEILRSIVNQAKKRFISLQFKDFDFDVVVDQESFSKPTTVELRLVQESEFEEPLSDDFHNIGAVDREALLESLQIFKSVSEVVRFSLNNDVLEISVSDKVQGSGNVKIEVDSNHGLCQIDARFKIRPLKDFLQKVNSDEVTISMTPGSNLRIQSEKNGRKSGIMVAERLVGDD